MDKSRIGFYNWPFEEGEKAKLIKISKPYSVEGLWYVNAVYLSDTSKRTKQYKHYFGDSHLLIYGADYVDGRRQDMSNWANINIHISKYAIRYRRPKPYLNEDKIHQHQFDYYTFGINNEGTYYIIPLHELLRAALAPDVFWLNQVTLLDSIDTRVIYENDSNDLRMTFLSDVPTKYVNMDQKIKHAAWVFSNPNIYEMINQIYQSIRNGEGVKFDFLFDELHFKAKVELRDNRVYVKEIVSFDGKRINCSNIFVHHAGLVEYEREFNGKEKKWTPVERTEKDKALMSDKTAAKDTIDLNNDFDVQSEYSSFVKIKRIRGKETSGTNITSKTIPINLGGKSKRTTADFGGLDTVPQLEFAYQLNGKSEGLFDEIFTILNLMQCREEVVSTGYHIGELNSHFRFRSICTLANEITSRKYIAVKLRLQDGQEAMLIEVERENLSLTTLMLVSNASQMWNLICHKILKGLIKKSGSWPDIEEFGFEQLEVYRYKHTNAAVSQREKRIFDSLNVVQS